MKTPALNTTPNPEILANHSDLEFIKICMKEVTVTKDGKEVKFPAFFGYHKLYDAESKTFVDVMTPGVDKDGKPIMVAKSFRLILDDVIKANLTKDDHFPYIVAVSRAEGDYFVTIDKDPDTKQPRLDKKGKQHHIVGIRAYRELLSGLTSMSLSDLDDLE